MRAGASRRRGTMPRIQSITSASLSRRGFLKRATALFAMSATGILAACGQSAAPAPTSAPAAAKPTEAAKPAAAAATTAPSPAVVEAKPAVVATVVASPAAAAAAKPAARTSAGDLKIGLSAKLTTLDPHGAQSVDRETHTAVQHIFDTLVKRDPKSGEITPSLATGWTNPDPTTWIFTLRQGVKFHDGNPLTSADVKATVERVVAQKGPVAPLWAQLDTVET